MPYRLTELEQLNQEVAGAEAARRTRWHLEFQLQETRNRRNQLERRIAGHEQVVGHEARDVSRLEGGVLAFLHRTLGTLEDRRSKERQELAAAELKLAEARAEQAAITAEIATLEQRHAALEAAPQRLAAALAAKEAWLQVHDEEAARALAEIGAERARLEAEAVEVREAAAVAEAAQQAIEQLASALDSAGSLGTLDLLGGGMLISLAKHGHLDEANALVPRVQELLARLASECGQAGLRIQSTALDLVSSGRFVDTYFDNVISDWTSSLQISSARDAVKDVELLLDDVRGQLARRASGIPAALAGLATRRDQLLAG
jgi:hypothetical protein